MYSRIGFTDEHKKTQGMTEHSNAKSKAVAPTPVGKASTAAKAKPSSKAKAALGESLSKGLTVKAKVSAAELQALRLVESMAKDSQYKKKKAAYHEELSILLALMESAKGKGELHNAFLITGVADIKKSYDATSLKTKLVAFVVDLEETAANLDDKNKEIMAVVRTRTAEAERISAKKQEAKASLKKRK